MKEKNARIFHYTIGERLASIMKNGIRLATAYVPVEVRPVVWFSTAPVWETTANKGAMIDGEYRTLTRDETRALGGGLVRVEVAPEVAPYKWKDYCTLSGDTEESLKGLKRTARHQGSDPRNWRVSFEPVPTDRFLAVEVWENSRWQSVKPRESDPAT